MLQFTRLQQATLVIVALILIVNYREPGRIQKEISKFLKRSKKVTRKLTKNAGSSSTVAIRSAKSFISLLGEIVRLAIASAPLIIVIIVAVLSFKIVVGLFTGIIGVGAGLLSAALIFAGGSKVQESSNSNNNSTVLSSKNSTTTFRATVDTTDLTDEQLGLLKGTDIPVAEPLPTKFEQLSKDVKDLFRGT